MLRMGWICAAVLAAAIYFVMLSWTLPAISAAAGGLAPFDMRPGGYSPEAAQAFLSALSADGHALYTGPQRWLDLFYPPLLAITLSGLIWRFFESRRVRIVLVAIAFGGMVTDWGENIAVARLLAGNTGNGAILLASTLTITKSALQTIVICAAVFAVIRAVVQRADKGRQG